jgi:putative endonuclease
LLKAIRQLLHPKRLRQRSPTQDQGDEAEGWAQHHLEQKGYRLVERNFSTRLGEIDLIMEKKDTLIFVEVRERNSTQYGSPAETVTPRKQARIAKAALMFLKVRHLHNKNLRFDIVSISNDTLTHLENAFAPSGYTL